MQHGKLHGSWIIGAIAVLLLALVFAELGTLIPESGALVHISHVSHGRVLGLIWSWILFILPAKPAIAPATSGRGCRFGRH